MLGLVTSLVHLCMGMPKGVGSPAAAGYGVISIVTVTKKVRERSVLRLPPHTKVKLQT